MCAHDAVILLKVGMGNMTLSIITLRHCDTFCHNPLLNPIDIISIATTRFFKREMLTNHRKPIKKK